jgi:hypothetical protein
MEQALALVFSLGTASPGVQSLLLTLLCLLFTLLHCTLKPLRDPQANTLQTLLLVCLTCVALSGTPAADAVERSSPSDAVTPSDTLSAGMQLVFGYVVPVAAVTWALLGSRVKGLLGTVLVQVTQR